MHYMNELEDPKLKTMIIASNNILQAINHPKSDLNLI